MRKPRNNGVSKAFRSKNTAETVAHCLKPKLTDWISNLGCRNVKRARVFIFASQSKPEGLNIDDWKKDPLY